MQRVLINERYWSEFESSLCNNTELSVSLSTQSHGYKVNSRVTTEKVSINKTHPLINVIVRLNVS